MPNGILRLSHRRTIDEATTVDRIVDLLFKDDNDEIDPRLSVYSISTQPEEVTQIVSEHSAFSEIDPPARACVDLAGLYTVADEPEDDGGFFSRRRLSHLVILLNGDLQICQHLATSLLKDKTGRFWSATASQVKEYGKRKYFEGDQEWVNSVDSSPTVRKWASKQPDYPKDICAQLH